MAVRHELWILAREIVVVENFSFSACDETRLSLYAGDKTMAVSGNWESRERPEFGSLGVRRDFGWAFESDDSCKINNFVRNQLIRLIHIARIKYHARNDF